MAKKHAEEFCRYTVRMAITDWLMRPQVYSDPGVGLSHKQSVYSSTDLIINFCVGIF
jgi:hypothetical protein